MNTFPLKTAPEHGVAAWNRWYDRVPRMQIVVGHRTLPAFRSIGIMGFHVAFTAALLTSIFLDLSLLVAVGLSATAALSFFGWALLRRAVTGAEHLVLLEHVWVAIALSAGYLWLAGAPVLTGLDVLTVALAPFLAFGRIGCFNVGCCHGTPTPTGIMYGPDHDHVLPWLINRRLRPVALLEAFGLFVIFTIGLGLAKGPPGTATTWFLASYAVLRFGTEALRGDQRPHVGPVSVARIMSVLQLGGAVWLGAYMETGRWAGPFDLEDKTWPLFALRVAPIVLVALAGGLLALVRSRQADSLTRHGHLQETWALITAAAAANSGRGAPTMLVTSLGLDVGVSAISPYAVHASFLHLEHDTGPVALTFAESVTSSNGIDHGIISIPTGWSGDARADIDHPSVSTANGDGNKPLVISQPTVAGSNHHGGYFTRSMGD